MGRSYNEGREYLNFSEWGTYNKDIKQNAIQKSIETIRVSRCLCLLISIILKQT